MKLARMLRPALTILALAVSLVGGAARAEDCNGNGVDDTVDIANATSRDCNANAIPDECDFTDQKTQFEIARRYEVGSNPVGLIGADFDNDGDTDLAVSVRHLSPTSLDGTIGGIHVARNEGGLRFSEMAFIRTDPESGIPERSPLDIYAVDLNGDGNVDILAQLRLSSEIAWTLSNGDGTFSPASVLDLGGNWVRLIDTGDVDGDGDIDVIATGTHRATLTVVRNDGAGNLDIAGSLSAERTVDVLLEDLDGDGDADLAVLSGGTEEDPRSFLRVFTSNGDLTFAEPQTYSVGDLPRRRDARVEAADLDGDSTVDLVVGNRSVHSVSVLLGNGDSTFAEPVEYSTGLFPAVVAIADLDGDGDLDIATSGDAENRALEELTVLLNNGDGTFPPPDVYPIGDNQQPINIAIADANGDERADIIVENYWGASVAVFQNTGAGTFEVVGTHPVSHGAARGLLVEDLDGDGDIDVATASIIYKQGLSILENVTGDGFNRGCGEFLRGDVNMDGQVSATDIVMLRRYFFEPVFAPSCDDAADVTDNDLVTVCDSMILIDALFRSPDWTLLLPMPSPDPGIDPTGFSGVLSDHYRSPYANCSGNFGPDFPLGCADHEIVPPEASSDVVTIGDVEAEPGETVLVPVMLTADVAVDAIQLVFSYDAELLEFDPDGLVLENTYYDRFEQPHPGALLTVHPIAGVVTLIAGSLMLPGMEVEPGVDQIIAWITVKVSSQAISGTVIELTPTNGRSGDGVGPFKLRNEIVQQGGARFLSLRPDTEPGQLKIVGDQAFFTRGDSNGDWEVDISDAIYTLSTLFLGEAPLTCDDAADANDDGDVDISDPIATLEILFNPAAGSFPAPHPKPGIDPTQDDLGCMRLTGAP